ncbi:MAG: hypothetical protein GY755_10640 [Chloroflexi bacterium]|nr:hypothetical protein [Chloroflexota bacterium]
MNNPSPELLFARRNFEKTEVKVPKNLRFIRVHHHLRQLLNKHNERHIKIATVKDTRDIYIWR